MFSIVYRGYSVHVSSTYANHNELALNTIPYKIQMIIILLLQPYPWGHWKLRLTVIAVLIQPTSPSYLFTPLNLLSVPSLLWPRALNKGVLSPPSSRLSRPPQLSLKLCTTLTLFVLVIIIIFIYVHICLS